MKRLRRLLFLVAVLFSLGLFSCNHRPGKPRVLVFSGTAAELSAAEYFGGPDWLIDTTSDIHLFREDTLKSYSAIVFLHTPGDTLDNAGQIDLQRYIEAGGGYAGIRAGTASKYEWGWYRRLTGIDDSSTISHQQEYDGGRAWYLDSLPAGASYSDTAVLRPLVEGIRYAIGKNNNLNYASASTPRVPEEERFTKTQLVQGTFYEPTEMTILPNLDILVVQRRGEVMLYNHTTQQVKQAGFLDVYCKTQHTPGVNAEEGVLGVQADPDFANNHFVYIYYSPIDSSVNRLSRFTLKGDSIDMKSEKTVLEVHAQREICCHTGGSIAFGPGNTLFVSTGDNSTPFDEPNTPYPSHGYGPLDDRPGHLQYDSRRGAGNTNDLRGKILRIKINPDGSYDIPEGNLFPKGEARTRPEIYVMGDRNPYRIAVDKKNGYLYWGEVGPDANNDSLDSRGPKGYDEVNQARKAGFFGWPYFVGNDYAYRRHDYETNVDGAPFDPAHPVNESRNNTGLRDLPPTAPNFIWYPYGVSPEFPQLGSGGRCAMAGPVYYSDLYPDSTRLPDYYNGKFFMYEWIRGYFKVITMKPNGDYDRMEPFMAHTKFNAPVDVEMGPDGKMYVLEYGNGWFTKNADAGIARIDYNPGNVAPAVSDFAVDKVSGLLPMKVHMSVKAKDFEKDSLTYIWDPGNGDKKETTLPSIDYTYTTPGDYTLSVTVVDAKKGSTKSSVANIYAGNVQPSVSVQIKGNKSFYFEGQPVAYAVKVDDPADTAKGGGKGGDLKGLVVSAGYLEGSDKAAAPQGHLQLSAAAEGKNIMLAQDCKTCHKIDEKSIGPAFTEVSKRYAKDPEMMSKLMQKVIKGGSGNWGEVSMPAHPALKEDDLRQIISWIQTLAAPEKTVKSLPAMGSVDGTNHQPVKDNGVLTISASYTNKGGDNIRPLTGSGSASLRNPRLPFRKPNLKNPLHRDHIDLTAVTRGELGLSWAVPAVAAGGASGAGNGASAGGALPAGAFVAPAYRFEVHLDSAAGRKIGDFSISGKGAVLSPDKKFYMQTVRGPIGPVSDGQLHNLYLVGYKKDAGVVDVPAALLYIRFFNH